MEGSEPSTSSGGSTVSTSSANASVTAETSASPEDAGQSADEFLSTGRTGRRNAMPDILEEKTCHSGTSELPSQLEKLSFNGI